MREFIKALNPTKDEPVFRSRNELCPIRVWRKTRAHISNQHQEICNPWQKNSLKIRVRDVLVAIHVYSFITGHSDSVFVKISKTISEVKVKSTFIVGKQLEDITE